MHCAVVSFDDYRPKTGGGPDRKPEEDLSESGIPILRVTQASELAGARELAGTRESDIVHLHDGRLWDFASEIAKAHASATVFTTHVLPAEQDRLRGARATQTTLAQANALAECDLIHVPSQAAAALLPEGVAHKTRAIPLATEPWPRAADAAQRPREGQPPLLLYVGRFADINGFAEFLEALPALFQEHPELRAVAAGGLPGNERAARRWRKRWHEMAGPVHQRLDMPGWLDRVELSELYARATMLVVPSWLETFAQVVLEGMLHGTPLITTGAGGIAELVDDESALLIEAKSASAIANAVNELLRDPGSAERRREMALQRAHEIGDWEARMPLFRRLYEEGID
jgi:glycosyltransferase involved in cell wall biosynthesis